MTALNVTDAVNTALYSKLNGDATLTALGQVYQGLEPYQGVFPYCCFQYMGGPGYTYSFTQRIIDDLVYVIKGVSRDDGGLTAGQISARADLLLTDSQSSLVLGTGWSAMYIRREGDVDMEEPNATSIFYHRGGRYRIVVQPA